MIAALELYVSGFWPWVGLTIGAFLVICGLAITVDGIVRLRR